MTVGAIRQERQTLSSRRTVGRPSTPAIEQAVKIRHLYWKIVWRFASVCLLDRVEGLCDSCGSFFIDPEVWTNRESACRPGYAVMKSVIPRVRQVTFLLKHCFTDSASDFPYPSASRGISVVQLFPFFCFFFCIFYLLDANWCLLSFSCP